MFVQDCNYCFLGLFGWIVPVLFSFLEQGYIILFMYSSFSFLQYGNIYLLARLINNFYMFKCTCMLRNDPLYFTTHKFALDNTLYLVTSEN